MLVFKPLMLLLKQRGLFYVLSLIYIPGFFGFTLSKWDMPSQTPAIFGKMRGLLSSVSLSCTLSSWAAENCNAQPLSLAFQGKDAMQR